MRFPLSDYLDAHRRCRHNLGESGMHGSLGPDPPLPDRSDREVLEQLREALARTLGVRPARLLLTHGATEANSWVVHYVRRFGPRTHAARVETPEYPSLTDLLGLAGFRVARPRRPATFAALSQPRNPEGDLWPWPRLERWAQGTSHLLVDETFREFSDARSLATRGTPGLWTTGTFTKVYGADRLRVGFAVAPPEEADRFERYVGVLADEVAPATAAAALELLRRRRSILRTVRSIVDANRAYLARVEPSVPIPDGPVLFDRSSGDGDRLARACLARSVLVGPGRFFGDRRGVRIGLTRRTFPADFDAYRTVRDRLRR